MRNAKYSLWLSEQDEAGALVDPRFVQAAYALEHKFFRYRQKELGCESMAATLIQSSVNVASRAAQGSHVSNPANYLFTTFTRLVDRHLAHAARESPIEDEFVEELVHQEQDNSSFARLLEHRILLDQIKEQMDEWTRQVVNMRVAGYSTAEIAQDLGLSVNVVSVRYLRGVSRAVGRLLHRKVIKGNWKSDVE
jgi:RNA polymerase sigma factor (sigma-70 family)